MRALFRGEEVSHFGHVVVDRARLWTLPETPPELLCAAVSEATAAWGSQWADGLATVNAPVEHLRRMLDAFGPEGPQGAAGPRELGADPGGGAGDRLRPVAHERLRPADLLGPRDCRRPSTSRRSSCVPRTSPRKVLVSSDLAQHVAWLQEYAALGFDDIALHHVGQDLDAFIDAFGSHVLPELA